VRDLIAMLDALASPQHRLSLAQALRSPLFGAGDDELIALAQQAAAGGDCVAALLAGRHDSQPALQRAQRLLPAWLQARANCRRTTCWTASSPRVRIESASRRSCRRSSGPRR
jgi:ATP-dependent exoDNAse (exonuclease V) beta subunit